MKSQFPFWAFSLGVLLFLISTIRYLLISDIVGVIVNMIAIVVIIIGYSTKKTSKKN